MAAVKHLTTEELAARLGVSPRTVEDWRRYDRGPSYLTVAGPAGKKKVRYRLADIEAWEQEHLVKPASA
jgi:transcriptional regulator with XRE-family HTH domain